ncbi:SusC/RagA family TonB-linked outer membrane protein [Pseudochryseolinea flava]|uniref:SusC/RagA family TonB-linked outer membrane protein n=2 Tax=Pseudochryseolinea flava TaxID=2059302 RepID=A0A364XYU4_9BACT|nr:SusC/RagA family TonB-linked outer membrane protein [Pseudochryseolinea flava]
MRQISRNLIVSVVLLLLVGTTLQAQQVITGTIRDVTGASMPGVNVLIKGTASGTSTDVEGKFSVQAQPDDVLVISFIGYQTREITVGQQTTIDVSLEEDLTTLGEVVVVGYGTQKKVLNTGANLQVKGEDISKLSTTNALQALQGQTPGVQISSLSGQPGSGMRVVIRGMGTNNGSGPLYVVDGVLTGDINYLNPNDIESITVLKDAASAAIYGSQSANGVILVTTKGASKGKSHITFDSFIGVQNVARKVDMLDAQEYATIMNEAAVNSNKLPYFTNDEIAALGKGTDWMDEMFVDNASTQNYSLSASGNSENSWYSTSIGYTLQEGVVGGRSLSNYERYNFRINSEHKLYKDIVKVGQNLTLSYVKNKGVGVGNQYNNSLRGAFNTSPFVPMYDAEGNYFDNSNSEWNNGEANPYATMVYGNQNNNLSQKVLGNLFAEISPLKSVKFRSTLGLEYNTHESNSFTPEYKLSIYTFNDVSRASQSMGRYTSLQWDNLLTYGFDVKEHHFDVMAGSSAIQIRALGLSATNASLIFNNLEQAWISTAMNRDGTRITPLTGGPDDDVLENRLSFFGRLNYNLGETYLFNATFRADGSSKFASNQRWGYFPSVSAGWVISNEDFLAATSAWMNSLKIRASWGQVGNQRVRSFQYIAPIQFSNVNYSFGDKEGTLTGGGYPNRLPNPALGWETSEQTNIGFDAKFLSGKLNVNFDWYMKKTKDLIIAAPILATAGADEPFINGGDVTNKGIEVALAYTSSVGELNYTVSVNGAYNQNKVGVIPNADGIIHGQTNQLFDNSGEFYRMENGRPIGYFWGLKTDGLFQTEEEVNNYLSGEGKKIQPDAQPGDVRYVDRNNDGEINDQDRTLIGNPNPDLTYGFSISANYKGFDLSIQANGVAGNQIVQSYRNMANPLGNYTSAILDRWHGPGSSNKIPRVTEDNRNWTTFSDLYIHDGDFLRISNITLGYDLARVAPKGLLGQARLYASVLNAFTFTKYEGMDPEVGYGIDTRENGVLVDAMSQGVDLGFYPRTRTYLIGLNVKF